MEEREEESSESMQKPPFRLKGQWDSRFSSKNYTFFRRKDDPHYIFDYSQWQTYYDVNGVWQMENLLTYFEDNDIEARGIKDRNIPAEMEMVRWKVVTKEPYEPEPLERKRKIRKKEFD